MSGHSKWSTIKRKKEKTDADRARIFTKISREIAVAVREAGPDPTVNFRLRDLMVKARAANMPGDNIDRLITRLGDTANYEQITYEGYGPGGVAMIVEALTDNRNRTAASVRHHFDKYGGNLGTTGCVSFLFREVGVIAIDSEGLAEDAVMEDALAAGAEDFLLDEGVFLIHTAPGELAQVQKGLSEKYVLLSAEVERIPASEVALTNPEHQRLFSVLLEKLDEDDDVQNVYHNAIEAE